MARWTPPTVTWRPPGEVVPPASWRFDIDKGWIPPGENDSASRVRAEAGPDFVPRAAPGWRAVVSPPGVPAPEGAITYTPETKTVYDRDATPPVDAFKVSLVPLRDEGLELSSPQGVSGATPEEIASSIFSLLRGLPMFRQEQETVLGQPPNEVQEFRQEPAVGVGQDVSGTLIPLSDVYAIAYEELGDDVLAQAVVGIVVAEGGKDGAVGDNGTSFGILQFNERGMLPYFAQSLGMTLDQAKDFARRMPYVALRWGIRNYLGPVLRKHRQYTSDPIKIAIEGGKEGQRAQPGLAYRYGDAVRRIFYPEPHEAEALQRNGEVVDLWNRRERILGGERPGVLEREQEAAQAVIEAIYGASRNPATAAMIPPALLSSLAGAVGAAARGLVGLFSYLKGHWGAILGFVALAFGGDIINFILDRVRGGGGEPEQQQPQPQQPHPPGRPAASGPGVDPEASLAPSAGGQKTPEELAKEYASKLGARGEAARVIQILVGKDGKYYAVVEKQTAEGKFTTEVVDLGISAREDRRDDTIVVNGRVLVRDESGSYKIVADLRDPKRQAIDVGDAVVVLDEEGKEVARYSKTQTPFYEIRSDEAGTFYVFDGRTGNLVNKIAGESLPMAVQDPGTGRTLLVDKKTGKVVNTIETSLPKTPVRGEFGGYVFDPATGTYRRGFTEPKVFAGLGETGRYLATYMPGKEGEPGTWKIEELPEEVRIAGGNVYIPAGKQVDIQYWQPSKPYTTEWLQTFAPSVGAGQDAPAPPVPPEEVVGTGHRFGQPVSMEGIHKGVDLQAVRGTPALSPVDGTVVAVVNDPAGLGLQLFIKDDKTGEIHQLSHLESVSVRIGERVSKGQPVATVGSSGAGSTGPHLDYRVRGEDGSYKNPEPYIGPLANLPRADVGVGEGASPELEAVRAEARQIVRDLLGATAHAPSS